MNPIEYMSTEEFWFIAIIAGMGYLFLLITFIIWIKNKLKEFISKFKKF